MRWTLNEQNLVLQALKKRKKVMRTIMTIPLALLPVQDQGGEQHAFCYELHKVKVDLVVSFSVGRVITFLDNTTGRVTAFSAINWRKA